MYAIHNFLVALRLNAKMRHFFTQYAKGLRILRYDVEFAKKKKRQLINNEDLRFLQYCMQTLQNYE